MKRAILILGAVWGLALLAAAIWVYAACYPYAATTIGNLNPACPADNESVAYGASAIREIKGAMQNTLTNLIDLQTGQLLSGVVHSANLASNAISSALPGAQLLNIAKGRQANAIQGSTTQTLFTVDSAPTVTIPAALSNQMLQANYVVQFQVEVFQDSVIQRLYTLEIWTNGSRYIGYPLYIDNDKPDYIQSYWYQVPTNHLPYTIDVKGAIVDGNADQHTQLRLFGFQQYFVLQ